MSVSPPTEYKGFKQNIIKVKISTDPELSINNPAVQNDILNKVSFMLCAISPPTLTVTNNLLSLILWKDYHMS